MSDLSERIAKLSPERRELLERRLKAQAAGAAGPRPIHKVSRDSSLPLSFAQQRLWFLEMLEPRGGAYNVPAALRLAGELDAETMRRAFEEIVRRHETLRTTFDVQGGEPVQVISDPGNFDLPLDDLSHLPAAEREAEADRLATAEAAEPFDLGRGPLIRARLLRLAQEEHRLLVTLHHIVCDGWSMGVLVRELSVLYEAYAKGGESPLPELPVQYADYAAWQRELLAGEALEGELRYWRSQLAGVPPALDLPTDRPRPTVQDYRGATCRFDIPAEINYRVLELSRREGVTPFMTLLAAFQVLLHRYTGQSDFSVGTPIANRNRLEVEPLIGFFVNTLVMRADLSGDPTFRELLARTKETAFGAYAHQELPFERLVEELQPERDLSRTPLFQVMFTSQNDPTPDVRLPRLTVTRLPLDSGTSKFDLTLNVTDGRDKLRAEFEYSTAIFDEHTVARMAGHLRVLLEGIAADPGRRISSLPLLTDAERQQLLVEWNAADRAF